MSRSSSARSVSAALCRTAGTAISDAATGLVRTVTTGPVDVSVPGRLTIHGVTKEITVPVTVLGFSKDGHGGDKAGFEATTTINRKDYGIVWNRTLDQGGTMLGDDVEIRIGIEGVIRPAEPPAKADVAPSKS